MLKYYLPKYSEKNIDYEDYKYFPNYKEFDIKIPIRENLPKTQGSALSHQIIIGNIMKGFTNIEGLLLVHDMGTGKTCTAIKAIEENIIDNEYGMEKAIILNRGKSIMNNFINELVNKCTIKYQDFKPKNEININSSNKKYSEFYTFDTFELFSKKLKDKSDLFIIENFNNTFLVIDEVHNILNTESEVYKQIERFIRIVPNKKILLLTGTPVRDVPSDIVPIINLLLPQSEKINKDTFRQEYYDDKGRLKVDKFQKKILGKVSYLKSSVSEIPIQYEGGLYGELKSFFVVPLLMSHHQYKYYIKAFKQDYETGGVYNNSRQAIRFVFPDGSYGVKGFEKYVKQSRSYKFTLEMVRDLRKYGTNREDIIKRIEELSVNYAYKIRQIFKADFNGEKTIVYDDLVKGSGLIVFSLLLQELRFNKFAILTAETTSANLLTKFQKQFNEDPFGKNISVILGSKVISEGFTFTDVLHEHVVPHWNNTETMQVIARGIRIGSHQKILDLRPDSKVTIYREMVLPFDGTYENSIDYIMTKTSEDKDIDMLEIFSAIKNSSITCKQFIERNGGKCLIDPKGPVIWDNYLAKQMIDPIMLKKIQKILSDNFTININEIVLKINNGKISEQDRITIYNYCYYLISEKITWINNFGIRVYLRNIGDTLFVTNEMTNEQNPDISFYTKYIKPWESENINNIYENSLSIILPKQTTRIQRLLEFALTAKLGLISKADMKMVDDILEKYNKFYEIDLNNQFAACWYQFSITNGKLPIMCYNKKNKIENINKKKKIIKLDNMQQNLTPWENWEKCTEEYKQKIINEQNKEQNIFENNLLSKNINYYGQINPETNEFCIKEIKQELEEQNDKRFVVSGKRCVNWNKKDLINISHDFGLIDKNIIKEKTNRNVICNELQKEMENLNIIKENKFCGIQKKIK